MHERSARRPGALAAIVPLLDPSASGNVDGDVAFSQFLPGLVDLHGSVDLARALEGADDPFASANTPGSRSEEWARDRALAARAAEAAAAASANERKSSLDEGLGDETSRWVEDRLTALEEDKQRVFAGLVDISSPELALRSLNSHRGAASAGRAARDVAAPFNRFFDTQFWSLRRSFEETREGLVPRLAARGDESARLERLDAALAAATRESVAGLRVRMVNAVHERTEEDARLAIEALPEPYELSDIESWFRPTGWVWGTRRRYGRTLRACFEHDAARLLALSRGAETRRT